MKRFLIILAIVVIVSLAVMMILASKGPNIKQFQYLVNPTISQLQDQNMLVVESKGNPDKTAGNAFKVLYKTYYSLKEVPKNFKMVSPRTRWNFDQNKPESEWNGQFALPIPDNVTTIPASKDSTQVKVYISKWQYGTVAEILHIGSYDTEQADVQRLKNYITQQGYHIFGEHEEVYLKGPGMFGPGNPKKYLTIIRYQIAK